MYQFMTQCNCRVCCSSCYYNAPHLPLALPSYLIVIYSSRERLKVEPDDETLRVAARERWVERSWLWLLTFARSRAHCHRDLRGVITRKKELIYAKDLIYLFS